MILTYYDPIIKLFGDSLKFLSDVSNVWTILIRMLLAIICAGSIGVERSRKRQAAGLRTYILVCLGAALVMMLSDFLVMNNPSSDAGRLGAQVISGIGFLGAGTILITSKNKIKGLTTAAGLWAAACTGLAIGAGFYTLGIIASISIVVILTILPAIEQFFRRKTQYFELHVELDERSNLKDLVNFLRSINVKITSIEKNPAYIQSGLSVYTMTLNSKEKRDHDTFIETIKNLSYVNYCEEIN
jgi:putative Mg2+ transporter-C (MgtC) family protein